MVTPTPKIYLPFIFTVSKNQENGVCRVSTSKSRYESCLVNETQDNGE